MSGNNDPGGEAQRISLVLADVLGEQSAFWDPKRRRMTLPEANMWLAVIQVALLDLARDGRVKLKGSWAQRRVSFLAADAREFFGGEGFRDVCETLQIHSGWARKKVESWFPGTVRP